MSRYVEAIDIAYAGGALAPKPRVAILGDSITAQNVLTATGSVQTSARGYWTWADILTGKRFTFDPINDNYGLAGDALVAYSSYPGIPSRVANIIASGARICVVLAGSNDIAIAGTSHAAMIAAMRDSVLLPLQQAGIVPIVLTVLPRGATGGGGLTSAQTKQLYRFNRWLMELGHGRADLMGALLYPPIVVDVTPYLLDNTSSVANPVTFMMLSDYTHPTQRAAYIVGRELAAVLNRIYPPRANAWASALDMYDATYNPSGSRAVQSGTNNVGTFAWTGGSLTTNAGLTPSGVLAFGLSAFRSRGSSTATMALSKENPRTDGPVTGERQFVEVSISSTGDPSFETYTLQLGSNVSVTAGEQFYLQVNYELMTVPQGLLGVEARLYTGGGGVDQTVSDGMIDTAVAQAPIYEEVHSGVLKTPILTVAVSNTAMNIQLNLHMKAANSSTAKIAWSDMQIVPVGS